MFAERLFYKIDFADEKCGQSVDIETHGIN